MKENAESLSAFFAESVERAENVRVVVSDRFKDANGNPIKWEFKPLPSSEVGAVRKLCYIKDANGRRVLDEEALAARCLALSIVYPDLTDAELQASYNARNAQDLLNNMLYLNEYNKASEVFNKMNLAGSENFTEHIDAVKNS